MVQLGFHRRTHLRVMIISHLQRNVTQLNSTQLNRRDCLRQRRSK